MENTSSNQQNTLLTQLEELCRKHDWYYQYSDDHSVWIRGNESWNNIAKLAEKCKNAGLYEEALKIIDKYCK